MGPIGPQWVCYFNALDTWPDEIKKFWSYVPAKGAEQLLDEAGYPRGKDGLRLRLSMWQNASRSDIGYHELEVGYWKLIGVEVELHALDNATLMGKLNAGDRDGMTWHSSGGADYGNTRWQCRWFSHGRQHHHRAPSIFRRSMPGGRSCKPPEVTKTST